MKRFAWIGLLLAAGCATPAEPPPQKPNVLLITIDTLRADRLGRGLTPALDGLAARGIRFTSARATAPLTLPSHASILTGVLPPEHGVRVNGVAMGIRPGLGRLFKDAGYQTAAFVGAYVLDRRFGLSGGFDTYDDRVARDRSGAPRLDAERRGDIVVNAALEWLGRGATPFFTWVHLYDPHAPYNPPQVALAQAGGQEYDGEVAFADAQVQRLLDWLHSSGEERRTIVAVMGDHGEGLGDHGELTHGMLAYDSTLRVPLIFVLPPEGGSHASLAGERGIQKPGRVVDTPVSLAQIAATLLHLAGVPVPDGLQPPIAIIDADTATTAKGSREPDLYSESLYPESAGWHAVHAMIDGHWKLIASSESELYDLSADPGEERNLASARDAMVQGMRRRARELASSGRGSATAVPADAAERLRALGYVSGGSAAPGDAAPNPARHIASWNMFERELTRLAEGNARAALPGLSKLARANPDAPVFQSTYARALKDTGRAAQAVDRYRRLVARWPDDAMLFHDLAVAASAAGMTREAERAEKAALALQPGNAQASNGLGLLLIEAGKPADAAAAFERAVQDDPSNATFWTNLGNARREAGDPVRAEQAYRTALDRDPRSPDASNGMGVLLVQQKRAGEAVRWFEQALAGTPRFIEARLNLGIAYQESGARDRAIEQYRRVLADAPQASPQYAAAQRLLAALGGG